MDILQLIDIIIWPITLLVILFGFRKYVSNAIKRVTSFSAGAGGVEFSFAEQIKEAKQKIDVLKTTATSKSGTFENETINTIHEKQSILQNYVNQKALDNGMDLNHSGIFTTTEELKHVGAITIEEAEMIHIVDHLLQKAGPNISAQEMNQISQLVNEVTQ